MNTLPATHRRPEPFADLPSDAIVSRRTQPLGAEISGRNSFTETRGVPLAGSVGPYLLGRQLGRGGMADVFEATEETTGAVVALKVMRPLKAGRRASVECFENEADVMGALNHPNIVALHDRGVGEGGLLYLAMPIVRGDSLRQKITAARHLPPEDRDQVVLGQLLPLFVQLCDAVEHAHRACILHRDLKPSNVLVTPEGQVKLIDWGVAAPLADPVVRSRHQLAARKEGGEAAPRPRFGGTPGYMSPEQIRLHPSGQDERSDVWSLGAILFEIAAWRRLVPGTTSHEVLAQTVAGSYRLDETMQPRTALGEALVAVAVEASQPARQDRHPSIAHLRIAVLEVIAAFQSAPSFSARPRPVSSPAA